MFVEFFNVHVGILMFLPFLNQLKWWIVLTEDNDCWHSKCFEFMVSQAPYLINTNYIN